MALIKIGEYEYIDTDGIKVSATDEPIILTFMLGDKEIGVTYSMMDDKLKKLYDSGKLTQDILNHISSPGFSYIGGK